jgi:preprotein translocase subunit SecF
MSEQKTISAKNLNLFFLLPAILSILAIISIALWGLKPGIDLSGGALLQVTYTDARPTVEQIQTAVKPLNLGEVRAQPTGTSGYILRERTLTAAEKNSLETALGTLGAIHEDQYTSVGPVIGAELLQKGLIALGLVTLCIIIFIAFAFRHVSKPVASWKYGVVVIITLIHDILVPTGVFAFLGHVNGAEVDSLFIVGLLTILGISINDTIVVFDRVRENLAINEADRKKVPYSEVVGSSIVQTIARSNNTSLTVVIMLAALFFVGPASTKDFALTLIIGMIAGTYSSIFLASPLLVVWEKFSRRAVK